MWLQFCTGDLLTPMPSSAAFVFAFSVTVGALGCSGGDDQYLGTGRATECGDRRLPRLVVLDAALRGLRGPLVGFGEFFGCLGVEADGGAFFDVAAPQQHQQVGDWTVRVVIDADSHRGDVVECLGEVAFGPPAGSVGR